VFLTFDACTLVVGDLKRNTTGAL